MAETPDERQTITINDTTYFYDSLDEESQKLIADIRIIDEEIYRANVTISISNLAKNTILEKIQEKVGDFETVPVEEPGGVEAPKVEAP